MTTTTRPMLGQHHGIQLSLPDGGDGGRVPIAALDLIAILAHAETEPIAPGRGDLSRRARHAAPVAVRDLEFWSRDDVADALESLLRLRLGHRSPPLTAADAPVVSVSRTSTPRADRRAATVFSFVPDLDSVAAIAGCAAAGESTPIAVSAAHPALATTPPAPMQRLFTDVLGLAPVRTGVLWLADAPGRGSDTPLAHAAAAAAVALSLEIDEVSVAASGVYALGLPGALSCIAAPAARCVHPAEAVALAHVLSLAIGRPFTVRMPNIYRTPIDIAGSLLAASGLPRAGLADVLAALPRRDGAGNLRVDHALALLGAALAVGDDWEGLPDAAWTDLVAPADADLLDRYVDAVRTMSRLDDADIAAVVTRRVGRWLAPKDDERARVAALFRCHAAAVREVLVEAIRHLAPRLIDGVLAPSSLLARASLPPGVRSPDEQWRHNTFRRRDDHWELSYDATCPVFLDHSKGMAYIHALVERPGRTFSAVELSAALSGNPYVSDGSAGLLVDERAVGAYRRRCVDARDELADAERDHDLGRMRTLREELEWIEGELARGVDLRGRPREASDHVRARKRVSNAIYRALRRIETAQPRLAEHLRSALSIGSLLCYAPREAAEWLT